MSEENDPDPHIEALARDARRANPLHNPLAITAEERHPPKRPPASRTHGLTDEEKRHVNLAVPKNLEALGKSLDEKLAKADAENDCPGEFLKAVSGFDTSPAQKIDATIREALTANERAKQALEADHLGNMHIESPEQFYRMLQSGAISLSGDVNDVQKKQFLAALAPKDDENTERSAFQTQVGGGHYKRFVIQPAYFAEVNKLSGVQTLALRYLIRDKASDDLDKCIHCVELLRDIRSGKATQHHMKKLEELLDALDP